MIKCSHGVNYEDRCPQCLNDGLKRVVQQKESDTDKYDSFLQLQTKYKSLEHFHDVYRDGFIKLEEENQELRASISGLLSDLTHLRAQLKNTEHDLALRMHTELQNERKIEELEKKIKEAESRCGTVSFTDGEFTPLGKEIVRLEAEIAETKKEKNEH